MNLQELTNELESFKEKAKAALSETFHTFFTEFPEVSHVHWTQYTPHFNDGDPCTFSVHDVFTHLTNEGRLSFGLDPIDEDDDEEDYCEGDLYDIFSGYGDERKYISPRAKEVCEAASALDKGVRGLEQFMEGIYGDGVQVTMYRDGTSEIDEYGHD
jgi:hypothetical protein